MEAGGGSPVLGAVLVGVGDEVPSGLGVVVILGWRQDQGGQISWKNGESEEEHLTHARTHAHVRSPIAGTDRATVMATQTKKAGRRIWEKRPLLFLLAQWNLLVRRPWNWLSFNHQPSSLELPWPSWASGGGGEGLLASPAGDGGTAESVVRRRSDGHQQVFSHRPGWQTPPPALRQTGGSTLHKSRRRIQTRPP